MIPAAGSLAKDRDFRLWVLGRSFSVLAAESLAVLLPIAVLRATGSARWTGVLGASVGLPYLVFGLWAGAVSDRSSRRRIMVGSDTAAGAAVLGLIAVISTGASATAPMIVGAFVVGTCFVWFDAAAWGALPAMVGKPNLVKANSLVWGVGLVAAIAAPSAATFIASQISLRAALAVCAAGYGISALATGCIRRALQANQDQAPASRSTFRKDIAEGLLFVLHTRAIRAVTTAAAMLSISSGGVIALTVIFATRATGYGQGDWRVGLFYSSAAIGALVASQLVPTIISRWGVGPTTLVLYAVYAPLLVTVSITRSAVAALIIWGVWFSSNTGAVICGIALRQLVTPGKLQGRVNTSARMLALGGAPVGAIAGGFVSDLVGVRWAVALAAAPILIALAILIRNRLWTLEIESPDDDYPNS